MADGDGRVGFQDLLILSANYGRSDAAPIEGDLNQDGSVSFDDFLLLAHNYGSTSQAVDEVFADLDP